MSTLTIDSLPEEQFCQSIESDLRHGRAAQAVGRLRTLAAGYAGPDGILPARFAEVTSDDLVIKGWDFLGDCIARHDRPGRPVTAIGISFGWAGDDAPGPDQHGHLRPHIETAYFNDSVYPFSKSGRDDLLDGYSLHGCTWAADSEASDNALSVDGIDDLYGALARLEAQLLASETPDLEQVRAGSLGACLLSALLFQAVDDQIKRHGLPRPLCVTAGSNGVYPYFDAPVAGMPEHVRQAAIQAEEEEELADAGVPGPRYSSLLMTGIPRAQKRAVLVLAETENEAAVRIANLRSTDPVEDNSEPAAPVAPRETEPAPLLAKKTATHAWDFRDMLSPAPTSRIPDAEPLPDRSEPDSKGLADEPGAPTEPSLPSSPDGRLTANAPNAWSGADGDPPLPLPNDGVLARKPPRLPSRPASEPDFRLIEPGDDGSAPDSLQERLRTLIAPPGAPVNCSNSEQTAADELGVEPVAEPERDAAPEPAMVVADPWPVEAAGLAWPFGPVSQADAAREELAQASGPQPLAPRGSVWARLKAWLRR